MSATVRLILVNVFAAAALVGLLFGCGPSMTTEEAEAAVQESCSGCHTADSFAPLAGTDWAATTARMEADYGLVLSDEQRAEVVEALNLLYGGAE